MALPKPYRLKQSRDFSAVYRRGQKAVSSHLVIRALAISSPLPPLEDVSQFGISIGQKVSKRSVIRNRIKRQIRAALRTLLPRVRSGMQVVVVVRPEAVSCEYDEFLRELEQLLSKLEVINGHS